MTYSGILFDYQTFLGLCSGSIVVGMLLMAMILFIAIFLNFGIKLLKAQA